MEKLSSSEHTWRARVLVNARPYAALFLLLVAGIWVSTNITLASPLHNHAGQAASGTPGVPAPVTTKVSVAPQANSTQTGHLQSLPNAQATRSAVLITTAGSTPAANDVKPATGITTGSSNTSSGFPWAWLLLLVPLLAALAYLFTRPRSTKTIVTTTSGVATMPSVTTNTSTVSGSMMPAVAAGIAAPAAGIAGVKVVCPNCGTSNSYDENFCHECGQDLRPTRAQMATATQD
ncbi:MAG: zinc ribbon domain-containing protein, partial [Chloroflexota bacterium]|nr:zinc ribbon domain-containing protein [Chloroflexota bacterium]